MSTPRYFIFEKSVWKFEPGQPAKLKTLYSGGWTDSLFESLEQFLADPPPAEEITEEEAEMAHM